MGLPVKGYLLRRVHQLLAIKSHSRCCPDVEKNFSRTCIGGQDYPNFRDWFAMVCMVWTMQTNGKPN